MARRYDHTREELYDLLLKAAADLVERDGISALSARRVTEWIGYSAGTLYNVFDNLSDLILHLNARTLDTLFGELNDLDLDGPPEEGALTLAFGYIDFTRNHPQLWALLFAPNLPKGVALPDWHYERIAKLLALLERAIAPLFEAGEEEARHHTARVLWTSLHGMCSLEASNRMVSEETVENLVSSLVKNYMAGLRENRRRDAAL
jgi:AcrR family transcriptional regulator